MNGQSRKRPLKHLDGQQKRQPIIALDIETDGFTGGFIYGATCDERTGLVEYYQNPSDIVDFLFTKRNRGCTFWSHNAQFDWRFLYPIFIERGYHIDTRLQGDSKIIILTIHDNNKHVVRMKDSYALVPASLAAFTKQFAPEHEKGHLDFDKETFDPSNPTHIEYLRGDVEGLMYSLQALSKVMNDAFGVDYGSTAAATAMKVFRSTLPEDAAYWRLSKGAEDFCRKAYHGGRVYLRDTNEHSSCTTLDINAMYASAMRAGVPYGHPTYTTQRDNDRPGIYRVRASTSDGVEIPIIPTRDKGSLIWFYGEAEAYITSIEIDRAIQLGYTIEIIEGYEFDGIIYPFDTFLDKCEALEVANKGNPIGGTAKLMRNSLYGKFGSKAEHPEYLYDEEECPDGYAPVLQTDGTYVPNLWTKTVTSDDVYIHPEWAAWITANARLLLDNLAQSVGREKVIYMDTDSVTAETIDIQRSSAVIGTAYGECKIDKVWEYFRVVAPKVYAGRNEALDFVSAAKGIPAKYRKESLFLEPDQHVSFDSPTSMLAMMKGEKRYGTVRKRSLSKLVNSSGYDLLPDGRVKGKTLCLDKT